MKTTIHLALTDDWELRGNGSGDIEQIQLRPMRELVRLYGRYGVRSTFNAEMMQQLTFRRLEEQHPELKRLADSWDEHVCQAFREGHDIQLHLHPQWRDARYDAGRWTLPGDWSLCKHDPQEAYEMLSAGRDYLEHLLRPIDPAYRCVSFRAGASAIAPSPFTLGLLARLGLVFDMSIVGGMRVRTRRLDIDYTNCEESFLPFYPRMDDARRVSDRREPIACVPIFHFYGSRGRFLLTLLSKAAHKAGRKLRPQADGASETETYAQQEWADVGLTSPVARVYEKAVKPLLEGKHTTSDIGALDDAALGELLRAIRRWASATGLREVPVILTNHSKYIADFAPIESFLRAASRVGEIKFVTLTEVARKLEAGAFPIRTKTAD
ncbi:MAG TPA: hypothetical protein VGV59_01520 [Pyrinomonadaceae bacterium]|nr:hypothetical protein [Pyrinomonadaceae bacterium]